MEVFIEGVLGQHGVRSFNHISLLPNSVLLNLMLGYTATRDDS